MDRTIDIATIVETIVIPREFNIRKLRKFCESPSIKTYQNIS